MEVKTAFVGGASRGIGFAIALNLAKAGYAITLTSRSADDLASAAAKIFSAAPKARCFTIPCDLTDPKQVTDAISSAHQLLGSLGAVICNAGAHPRNFPVEDYPVDYWESMLTVNLSSAFYCVKNAVPLMKKQQYGRIMMISSVAGKKGFPNACAYVAAKHGIIGLTKSLANELGTCGITVNALCPGFVDTDMTKAKTALREASINNAAIHKVVDIEDIAAFARYLLSSEAKAITGQAINVCNGLVI